MRRLALLMAMLVFGAMFRADLAEAQACKVIYEGKGCENMPCGCGRRDTSGDTSRPDNLNVSEPEWKAKEAYNPYAPAPTPSPDWNKIKIPETFRPPNRTSTLVSPGILDDLSCNAECRFQRALSQDGAGQSYGSGGGANGQTPSADSAKCAMEQQRAETEITRINRNSGEGICEASKASEQIGMIYKNFLLACPEYDPSGSSMDQVVMAIDMARETQSKSCD